MSLTGVADSLKPFIRPVKYFKKLPKTKNAKGEAVTEYAPGIDMEMPVTTVSTRQLIAMSEGSYTSEDRNFYQLGNALSIEYEDKFEFNGVKYIVTMIKDMTFEAGFIRYVCKKEIRKL
ncbi:hypothetical protein JWG45_21325 [Leptospira sp. 201903070]|uniref:Phage head-tail adapter protein n=1 Tax=Leptospira ainlahdjerensis TaxID=2810033 RepID=A0ABS2UIF0_9LEPT|nr:hypothetical protein [Leptospira ainlahdjerensis]MBM9579694.1 hypothetical protein [Leptospira ainlahdjerensis]